ncbi:MAG: hypothetical protein KC910_10500 [Candidatus Eremiobacteraeota bacterium]|nr:hypothetical protein [Candidatus Eremiobacteraeota bacterium]
MREIFEGKFEQAVVAMVRELETYQDARWTKPAECPLSAGETARLKDVVSGRPDSHFRREFEALADLLKVGFDKWREIELVGIAYRIRHRAAPGSSLTRSVDAVEKASLDLDRYDAFGHLAVWRRRLGLE